jgi:hypothetical protein
MRAKYFDCLVRGTYLQGNANAWVGVLKLGNNRGQNICTSKRRGHHRYQARARFTELGGTERSLREE